MTCSGRDQGYSLHVEALVRKLGPSVRDLGVGDFDACAVVNGGRVQCVEMFRGVDYVSETDGLRDVERLTMGALHACVLHTGGTVSCWGGLNSYGELGDGTRSNRSGAAAVRSLPPITQVVAGGHHTCARGRDGRVFCWGRNTLGQVGDATTEIRPVPVPLAWCPRAAAVVPPVLTRAPLLARLRRHRCRNDCPAYSLHMHADGTVIYEGEDDVTVHGIRRKRLTPEQVRQLAAAFERARFRSFDERCCAGITDVAGLELSLMIDGRLKTIHTHDVDLDPVPPALRELGQRIDAIVGSAELVGAR